MESTLHLFLKFFILSIRVWGFDIYIKLALRFVSWDIRRCHNYFCLSYLKLAAGLLTVGNHYIFIAIINCFSNEANYTIFWCYISRTLDNWRLWILYYYIKCTLAFISWAINCVHSYLGLTYWEFTSRSMTVDNFKTLCPIISHSRSEVYNTVLRWDISRTLYVGCYCVDIYFKCAFGIISCVICPCHCYNCLAKWKFTSRSMTVGYLDFICNIIAGTGLEVHNLIFLCNIFWAMNHGRMLIQDSNIKFACSLISRAISRGNCDNSLTDWELTARSLTVVNFEIRCSIISHNCLKVYVIFFLSYILGTLNFWGLLVLYCDFKCAFCFISSFICRSSCYDR